MEEGVAPLSPVARHRRTHQRYVLVGQVAILHMNGQAYPCTVRNISAAGLMAVLYETELREQTASVEFANGERLSGTILWVKDWQFGFAFDQRIDAQHLLTSLGEASSETDRRSDHRLQVDCSAKLRVNNRFYFGRIVDISCGGARFATPGRLKKSGDGLLIAPDLPPMSADIRWAENGEFGLEFRERIPTDALQSWVARREPARDRTVHSRQR